MKHISAAFKTLCFLFPFFHQAQALFTKQSSFGKSDFSLARPDNSIYNFGRSPESKAIMSKYDATGNGLWMRSYTFNYLPDNFEGNEVGFVDATNSRDSTLAVLVSVRVTNGKDAYCLRLQPNGDTLWCRKVSCDGATSTIPRCISSTSDSGFVICGQIEGLEPSGSFNNSFVAKLSKTGTLKWMYRMNAALYAIKQTPDSGFICIGGSNLTKLDKFANFSWQKKIIDDSFAGYPVSGYDLSVENDGFLCLVSSYYNKTTLVKTDFSGSPQWAKKYSLLINSGNSPIFARLLTVKKHTANRWLVNLKGETDGWVLMVDSLGTLQMPAAQLYNGVDAVSCKNKNIALFGNRPLIFDANPTTPANVGIMITDSLGTNWGTCWGQILCTSTLQTASTETVTTTLTNSGYLSAIHPTLTIGSLSMFSGCLSWSGGGLEETTGAISLLIYPNPSNGKVVLKSQDLSGKLITFSLKDVTGRTLLVGDYKFDGERLEIDLSGFHHAVYFYTLSYGTEAMKNGKIIVAK